MRSFLIMLSVLTGWVNAGFYDTLSTGNWIPAEPLQNPPFRAAAMGFEKCDFADALNGFVFLGGYNQAGSEPQNALWTFRSRENRWRLLDAGYTKSVKNEYMLNSGHDRSLVYDAGMHCIFEKRASAMGGAQTGYLQYDAVGNTGRCYWANPSAIRESGSGASCYDPDSNCFYFFSHVYDSKKIVRYRASANEWKRLASVPDIRATQELAFAIVYERVHKKVVLFAADSQVWTFDPALNRWDSVATNSHVSTEFPDVIWNDVLKKIVVFNKGLGRTYLYDLGLNAWTEICLKTDYPIDNDRFIYALTYNPYDNVYVNMRPAEAGNYSAQLYVMRDSLRSLSDPPVFSKKQYNPDVSWSTVGVPFRHDSLGYAHFPTLAVHQGVIYVGFQESKAHWDNTGGIGMIVKRWNGSVWETVGTSMGGGQSVSLYSDGTGLYAGSDGYAMWHGNRSNIFKAGAGRLDSVGNQAFWDFKSLPYLIRYQGALHAVHMGNGTMSEMDHLHHSVFDSASGAWRHVDSITRGYVPDNEWSMPSNVPIPMRFPFSVAAKGDSLFVATTDLFMAGGSFDTLPMIANVRCFDGAGWSTLPPVNADRKTMVGTHPTLAVGPDNGSLYIAYLKRPYAGRKNNEVFVEKWNGSGWEPMGGTLNVHGQDEDAWSYRPCIAVNSAGVPYVAWNEHVWGECAQVFVKHWDGTQWASDVEPEASLNVDGLDGGAQSVSLAFENDTPVVAWSEYSLGHEFFRKIVVKKFTGYQLSGERFVGGGVQSVLSVSPNPFHSSVTFSLSGALSTDATIKVFDLSGKLVADLSGKTSHGRVVWNAAGITSGVYVATAQKGALKLTRKTVYSK